VKKNSIIRIELAIGAGGGKPAQFEHAMQYWLVNHQPKNKRLAIESGLLIWFCRWIRLGI